jgi:hypothetical protein
LPGPSAAIPLIKPFQQELSPFEYIWYLKIQATRLFPALWVIQMWKVINTMNQIEAHLSGIVLSTAVGTLLFRAVLTIA